MITQFEKALSLYNNRKYEEAKQVCLESIAKNPSDYLCYNLLGLIEFDKGNIIGAQPHIARAISIKPDFFEAYGNMGVLYMNSNMPEDAENCFKKALMINPQFLNALANLAQLLSKQKRFDESLMFYQKILDINPNLFAVYNNMANIIYNNSGKTEEAISLYQKALKGNPKLPEAYVNMCSATLYAYGEKIWLNSLEQSINACHFPDNLKADMLYSLALAKWLHGDGKTCYQLMDEAEELIKPHETYANYQAITIYARFMKKLSAWFDENKSNYFPDKKPDGIIHFIGESHSLTCSNKIIKSGDKNLLAITHFIRSCRAWDLVNDEENKYKIAFWRSMKTIPSNEPIIITLGEIDCRAYGGMFKRYTHKNIPYKESVDILLNGYLEKIIKPVLNINKNIQIWGVPAPTQYHVDFWLKGKSRDEFIEFIRYYNSNLEKICNANKIGFIDNFASTDSGNGIAFKEAHIDNFHLVPDLFVKNIEKVISKALVF